LLPPGCFSNIVSEEESGLIGEIDVLLSFFFVREQVAYFASPYRLFFLMKHALLAPEFSMLFIRLWISCLWPVFFDSILRPNAGVVQYSQSVVVARHWTPFSFFSTAFEVRVFSLRVLCRGEVVLGCGFFELFSPQIRIEK